VRLSGEDGWMGYPGRKKRGCSSGHRTGCLPVLEQVKRRRILKDRGCREADAVLSEGRRQEGSSPDWIERRPCMDGCA